MMLSVSTDLTNPWYLTIFGCCKLGSAGRTRLYRILDIGNLTSKFFNRSISSCNKISDTAFATGPLKIYHNDPQFTLRKVGQLDLLHGDRLSRIPIQCPVNRPEGPSAQTIPQLLYYQRPWISIPIAVGCGLDTHIVFKLCDILGRRL